MIYVVSVILCLLFFFTIRQFILESKSQENIGNYMLLPMIFTLAIIIFSTLMPFPFLIQILLFFNYLFLNFYFRSIFRFLLKKSHYQNNSLENFSSYGNFFSIYLISSALYGFQSFLGADVWLIIIFLLSVITLIIYQVLWANKILTKQSLLYIIILPLIYIEFAWSISFLSLSFYILGLILAIAYYIGIGLTKFYLIGKLNSQILKMYLIFGFVSLFAVLVTSRWI
jgi:hypothetical protein